MAWKPGESGNPEGRAKDKLFRDALIMELKSKGEDMPELRQIARAAIDQAIAGDSAARNFIADRLDGKVPRPVEVSDADQPVTVIIKKITRDDRPSSDRARACTHKQASAEPLRATSALPPIADV